MTGSRFRIGLLALGVVFGFGSAFAHMHGHHHCGGYNDHDRGHWEWHDDRPSPPSSR